MRRESVVVIGSPHVTLPTARRLLAAFLAVTLAACGSAGDVPAAVASIELSTTTVALVAGADVPLTARLLDASGRDVTASAVVWTVRDPSVAQLAPSSTRTVVIRGVTPGTTEVSANVAGRAAVATVVVAQRPVVAVAVQPASLTLRVGGTGQLQARTLDATGAELTGRPVSFVSSDPSVAIVAASGLVTAVAPGGTTVAVASEGRTTLVTVTVTPIPTATVVVTPAAPSAPLGGTVQFTATALDSLARPLSGRVATWASSDERVATVSTTGLAVAVGLGTAQITAAIEGRSASQPLVVRARAVAGVTLTAPQPTLAVGESSQIAVRLTDADGNILTGRTVVFASDLPAVATVTPAGLVTGRAPGVATIAATSEGVRGTVQISVVPVAVASVAVSPPTADVTVGESIALVATPMTASGTPLGGRAVQWTSGAPSVASVSTSGIVTALGPGTALIFAQVDGVIGQSTITVRASVVRSVTVSPATASIPVAGAVVLDATPRDAAGAALTGRPVAWTSSDESVAVVSSAGRVVGIRPGTATITATSESAAGRATIVVTASASASAAVSYGAAAGAAPRSLPR